MLLRAEGFVQSAGPPAFTPASLPGIVHWWDAQLSTKTGSPGDISQMNDLIGTKHVSQAVVAAQPDDNTRTINGRVALDFDGADNLTNATAPAVTTNGTVYVAVVAKVDVLAVSDIYVHCGAMTAADDGANIRLDDANGTIGRLQLSWANGTTLESYRPTTPVVGIAGPHFIEVWVIGTTGGVNIAVDGTTAAGATNTVGYGSPDSLGIFARATSTTNAMDGVFCSAIVCTAVPSAPNRASLLSYSQSRWGTP